MTISDNGARPLRRCNRNADPCPAWCRTDHSELLVPGRPKFGYMDGHYSDPIHQPPGSPGAVRLARDPRAASATSVSMDLAAGGAVRLYMSAEQAGMLAGVIDHDADDADRARLLAAELRAAALIALTVNP